MVQFITIYMNPKLTNITLNCVVCMFNVNDIDFTGKNYTRIGRNTFQHLDCEDFFFGVTVDY